MAASPTISRWSLFLGVIYILVGMIAIATPLEVALFSALFFGVLLTMSGIAGLVHSFWQRGWAGFFANLFAGLLATFIGLILIFDSAASIVVITFIVATYFLLGGIFKMIFAIFHQNLPHRGALIFSGIIGIILGTLILVHWPSSAFWVIGTFIGIDLIFYGVSLLSASRKHV